MSRIAAYSDADLAALVDTDGAVGVGGGSSVVDVDGVPVFAKRIPLTDRELASPRSTANLFDVPLLGQYGVVSPGFNAWRELAANEVLTGTGSIPRLLHWRVLPGRAPVAAEHADIDAVVAALHGSAAVRARLEALAAASHSLVLFSEYVPLSLRDWLRDDPASKAELVEQQLMHIVAVLRDHELLHMDGHFDNFRTDGERLYLTDFGLVTSPRFELSTTEHAFVRRHATHDAEYAAMRLVNWLATEVCGVSTVPAARNEFVAWCATGGVPTHVPPGIATILARHAPAAARMNSLYWQLFQRIS
ncbi:serine/threonine protein phosphatase [Actinophytocola sp. NPDC049390]|uniref:serine/threonine protein phosphatase n=1 Tax=Actinophytocola sp. NPDC049390 TaxID=3363894 RepID=UPI00379E4338